MESNKDKSNQIEVHDSSNKPLNNSDFVLSPYFNKDKNFTFVFQKIKKISAAIYMLTNFFDDQEPLKWSLRKLSTDLLNTLSRKSDAQSGEVVKNKLSEMILEIMSLLEVASFAGLLSPMNISIIRQEFNGVLEKIRTEGISLGRNIFGAKEGFFKVADIDNGTEDYEGAFGTKDSSSGNNIKDKNIVLKDSLDFDRKDEEINNNSEEDLKPKLKVFSPVAVKKNKRQSAIINLIKKKKEIMIKDVAMIIDDCSEKTLQRELASLVDSGILMKQGERRWTRYSFA